MQYRARKIFQVFRRLLYTARILLEELGGPRLDTYDDDLICGGDTIKPRASESSGSIVNDVAVFPNPSTGMITLSGLEGYTDITIYNVEGIQVYSRTLEDHNGQLYIDLSSESVGIYYIIVNGPDKTSNINFILVD